MTHALAAGIAFLLAAVMLLCSGVKIAAQGESQTTKVTSAASASKHVRYGLSPTVLNRQIIAGSALNGLLFDTASFSPRWQSGRWTALRRWIHIVSAIVNWLAHMAIPAICAYYLWRRQTVPLPGVLLLFVAFIIAYGFTHLLEAAMFWWPAYRIMGLTKVCMAIISVVAIVALLPLIPRLLTLRDPLELERINAQLRAEVAVRSTTESALRASEARFERAIEGSSNGLWEWDIGANKVWYAPRFAELLGYSETEFGNALEAFDEHLHPDDSARVWAAIHGAIESAQAKFNIEYRLRTKSGDYRWFHARGVVYRDEAGTPAQMSGTIQDITDRVQAEETVRQRDAQLRESQKLQAIGQLAGGVAHEFNNLLQAISGYCHFAMKGLPPESRSTELLMKAQIAVDRGAQLTQQLLTFSQSDEIRHHVMNVNDTIHSLSQILRPTIGESIKIEVQLAADLPCIDADPTAIQQLLLNVALNARDAMPSGGILRFETQVRSLLPHDVNFFDLPPGRYVCIRAIDNGCGMDNDTLNRAIEPFFTTKEVGKGAGLGLAQVYGVVEQHRGAMRIKSRVGRGTTIEFLLPAIKESPTNQIETPAPRLPSSARILIADDDPFVREAAIMTLEDAGYETVIAKDGREAVELFRNSPEPIDLLLLDVAMPALNGHEAYRQITEMAPEVPVLFCTGYDATAKLDAGQAEYYATVSKPYRVNELLRAIGSALAGSRT